MRPALSKRSPKKQRNPYDTCPAKQDIQPDQPVLPAVTAMGGEHAGDQIQRKAKHEQPAHDQIVERVIYKTQNHGPRFGYAAFF